MRARPHFLQERCADSCNRFPWVTLFLVCTNIIVFYVADDPTRALAYRANGSPAQWGTAWSYAFFHVDAYHLWSNMIIFVLGGALLEATDTNGRLLVVSICAVPCSALGHGIVYGDRVGVIGFSGVVYAVLAYQLALLVKNWREMRCRPNNPDPYIACRACVSSAPVRIVIAIILLLGEIGFMQGATNVSRGGHGFGALSGVFVGLAIGSNVLLDWWELVIPVIGMLGQISLSCAGFATRQSAVGMYGLLASLPIALYAAKELRRWTTA